MNIYALALKQKSGLLSELQSDTIYGHFCWRLMERLGIDKLTEFISLYKNGNPVFLVSDGLLKVKDEIRFPRPFVFSKPEAKEKKTDKIIEFVERKKNKEKNYLTLSELNAFLESGKVTIEEKTDSSVDRKQTKKHLPLIYESLRVSVQIDRTTFTSSEGRVFSYNPKHTRDDVSYVILLKVFNKNAFDSFDCRNILYDTFTIGFGKRKSAGYGQFDVIEFEGFGGIKSEPQQSNAFMVLGNYLPSHADGVTPIGYEINVKYGRLGEELSLSVNPFKNPVVFMTAGSCFRTDNSKKFYGRITNEGEVSPANSFAVQFGMPFTLNINSSN
jgi:CRISPR-associated protein Csm4